MCTDAERFHAVSMWKNDRPDDSGYRKITVKNYIVFYRVDDKANTIYIMRVIYGRRDYINLI